MIDLMVIPLDEEYQINLEKLPEQDWKRIKSDVSFLIKSGHTKDIGKAYIAAFFIYLNDLALLSEKFDENKDKIN